MPSTYSPILRLNYQAPGDNLNTWGVVLNNQVFQLIENAIAKRQAVVLAGATYVLTAINAADDESRSAFLDVSGTPGTIETPALQKLYLVRNGTAGDVVITANAAGVDVTIAAGNVQWIACDGVNWRKATATDFQGDRLRNIGTAVDPADAATKAQVDTVQTNVTNGDAIVLAAAKAYTDATAFSLAAGYLPGQVGNDGKFLKTVASAALWAAILTSDLPMATLAQARAGLLSTVLMAPDTTAAAIIQLASFGPLLYADGSDGDVTINGAVTLSRDMYYRNLVLGPSAALNTNGWAVYVSEELDATAAPAGAIYVSAAAGGAGVAGGVGTGGTGGTAPGAATPHTVGVGAVGTNGGTGTVAAGNPSGGANSGGNGGVGGASGAAGDGISGAGGTASPGGSVSPTVLHKLQDNLTTTPYGSTVIAGGASGGGGGGGGGATGASSRGGGGGASGAGGSVILIFARFIRRGAGTAAGAIRAKGGNGGAAGASDGVNNAGGGAGGGGGGGGWVFICCSSLTGAAKADAVDVTGGNGAAGGNGTNATYKGGFGGGAGAGGRYTLVQMGVGSYVDTLSAAAAIAAVAPANAVGGAGAVATTAQFAL